MTLSYSSRCLRMSKLCASTRFCALPIAEVRSGEHTSELQSQFHLVCRLLLEEKKLLQADREQLHLFAGILSSMGLAGSVGGLIVVHHVQIAAHHVAQRYVGQQRADVAERFVI